MKFDAVDLHAVWFNLVCDLGLVTFVLCRIESNSLRFSFKKKIFPVYGRLIKCGRSREFSCPGRSFRFVKLTFLRLVVRGFL